jgi:drug/metabolite transporter (DMT)-like permease
MALAVTGMLIIYAGQMQVTDGRFILAGVGAGIATGVWNVLPKLISDDYPKLQLIAIDAAAIVVANIMLSFIVTKPVPHVSPTLPVAQASLSVSVLAILLYGVTQIAGDFLIIVGFRRVDAQVGSVILPLEAVFGALYAFLFFGEQVPVTTLLGGAVILMGSVVSHGASA